MPKFETEIDVSLDDVWNKSTKTECDEFFYRTLDELYLENNDDVNKITAIILEHKDKIEKILKEGK